MTSLMYAIGKSNVDFLAVTIIKHTYAQFKSTECNLILIIL